MVLRIVKAKVCGPSALELTFNEGSRKRVDVKPLLRGPVFEPLKKPSYFRQMKLDQECGTVCWPNGADFAPEALFEDHHENRPVDHPPDCECCHWHSVVDSEINLTWPKLAPSRGLCEQSKQFCESERGEVWYEQ